MALAVVNGIGTALLTALLVPPLGSLGAVLAYTCTSLIVGLGGGTVVFVIKRRQWSTLAEAVGRV